jgi:hypothetical protein
VLSIAVSGAANSVIAADVDLTQRWVAGDEAVFEYTADSTRKDEVPAFQMLQEQRTRQEMTIRRKVIETGPSGTVVELVFERIKVVVTQGKMFMLYDSRKPPAPDRSNVLEDAIKPVLKIPIRIVLNPDGTVRDISGLPPAPTVDGRVRPLIVDTELLRDSLAPMYGVRTPPAKTKIGESWPYTETLPGGEGRMMILRHKRTLASANDKTAAIRSVGTAEFKPVEGAKPNDSLLAEFACTGQHEWDLSRGRIGWTVVEQRMVMHGTFRQARSEHTTTTRMTLAAEGFTPPPPPAAPESADPPAAAPTP